MNLYIYISHCVAGGSDRMPSMDDLKELKYLERCIKVRGSGKLDRGAVCLWE